MTRDGRRVRRAPAVALASILAGATLAACGGGGGDSGIPTLTWYINPDGGGQAAIAERCTEEADGEYEITTQILPSDATSQREQLVRRLAAGDDSIDIMSIDPPFTAEFAQADFLEPIPEGTESDFTDGVLDGAVEAATFDDSLVAVPFWSNTQVLWYKESVAKEAGLDMSQPVTWDQIIDAAAQTDTSVEIQGQRAETYAVFVNALIASAGGSIIEDPEEGQDATITVDSEAGKAAAEVIQKLTESGAANSAVSTAAEGETQAAFNSGDGAFMTNWTFIYASAPPEIQDDLGWTMWPRVVEGEESAPPFGGINLGVSSFSEHPDLAYDAVACATTVENGKQYWLDTGNAASRSEVYDDEEIREAYPMADLFRESIDQAVPRPSTPYWIKVGTALYSSWHSPGEVDPESTPAESQAYIEDVLQGKALL